MIQHLNIYTLHRLVFGANTNTSYSETTLSRTNLSKGSFPIPSNTRMVLRRVPPSVLQTSANLPRAGWDDRRACGRFADLRKVSRERKFDRQNYMQMMTMQLVKTFGEHIEYSCKRSFI